VVGVRSYERREICDVTYFVTVRTSPEWGAAWCGDAGRAYELTRARVIIERGRKRVKKIARYYDGRGDDIIYLLRVPLRRRGFSFINKFVRASRPKRW